MVLLVAERPAIPIVVVRVYLHAGSVYDPPDAGGLANLTADMLTRGTAKRSGPELDQAIEFVGGSLEGDAGRDGAAVSLSVLKKDLKMGLDLLAEVLLTPAFPEPELKRRSEEIAAAIERSEQDPGTVAAREMALLLYPGHPYRRPVAGTVESVKKITRAQIVGFYRENYRPDTAVVAVVGDVTRDEVRRELLARLGSWSATATPRPVIPPAPAVAARRVARDPPGPDPGHRIAGAPGHPPGPPGLLSRSWSRTMSSAAAPRPASTRECAKSAGSRIRYTARSGPGGTAPRTSWGCRPGSTRSTRRCA